MAKKKVSKNKNKIKTNKKAKSVAPVIAKTQLELRQATAQKMDEVFKMSNKDFNELFVPVRGGSDGITSQSAYSLVRNKSNPHEKIIDECVDMYRTMGVVRNIIDLMSDFAVEKIDIIHSDPKQQAFYRAWANRVQLQNRLEHIARTYFKMGNVAIYSIKGKITKKKENELKTQGFNSLIVDDEVAKRNIPIKYKMYDPRTLRKVGADGFKTVELKVDPEIVTIITKDGRTRTKKEKEQFKQLSEKLIKEVKKITSSSFSVGPTAEVWIPLGVDGDDPNLTMIYYKKDDWDDWADPITFSALDALKFKQLLRDADNQALRNVINAITIFKLGRVEEDLPPSPDQYEKLISLLNGPVGSSKTLVWNNLIEVETHYAPIEKILGPEKYEEVDSDILASYGISSVIANTGKSDNSYSNSFLSVKTMLERLETGRSEFKHKWLMGELRQIMKAMGWKIPPHIRFGRMSLRDENAEKQIIMQLVDRNIMSPETALEYFEENFTVEIARMKRSKEAYDKANVERQGPFSNNDQELNTPDKTEKDFDPKGPGQDGRPKNDNSPQEKMRDTKPLGASSQMDMLNLKDRALEIYAYIEDFVSDLYCKKHEVKNKKSLVKQKKEELENIIFNIYSNLGVDYIENDAELIAMFDSSEKIRPDERILETYQFLIDKIKAVPSAQQLRNLKASSFVMVRSRENAEDSVSCNFTICQEQLKSDGTKTKKNKKITKTNKKTTRTAKKKKSKKPGYK